MVSSISPLASVPRTLSEVPMPVRPTPSGVCAHCGLPTGDSSILFCCAGCETVFDLLSQSGLARYYELGKGSPMTSGLRPERGETLWLDAEAASLAASPGMSRVTFDVQGVHCSACVWLFQEIFARTRAEGRILVSPSTGTCELTVSPSFPLAPFVHELESFGYRFGPQKSANRTASGDLLWRMGVCIAIAMNTMIFAISFYAGLSSGPTYDLFCTLNFVLATVSVAVGGPVFFRSAWATLRRNVFHLDLPIAIGILLAFGSSAHGYFARRGDSTYFDTLNVFIALMLVGRFLRERIVEKNRSYLLESDGADGLLARRIRNGIPEIVPCTSLKKGDVVLLAPGDLVSTESILQAKSAEFSLDWISGESDPVSIAVGGHVRAGAFLAGHETRTVRCETDFGDSELRTLLRRVPEGDDQTLFWRRFVRIYVSGMLLLALGTFAFWSWHSSFSAAFEIVTGLLIVTCPCAVGIATPLAYELAHAGLRTRGFFVRRAGFLDRALKVRNIVFDKTGTLTTGRLRVRTSSTELRPSDRDLAYNLAIRSSHPKAEAIAEYLERQGARFDEAFHAKVVPGKGICTPDETARLGSRAWAAPDAEDAHEDVWFSQAGNLTAAFQTEEMERPFAKEDLKLLSRQGYNLHILTGDSAERTLALASRFEFPENRTISACSPREKAAWIHSHEPDRTLMIGDGVNDTLALQEALCSGTPAIDRPYVASTSDFFFTTPGLSSVRQALRVARTLRQVVVRNIVIGSLYNVVTVGLAITGKMSPLICAVIMPLSSISLVVSSTRTLSQGARLWK